MWVFRKKNLELFQNFKIAKGGKFAVEGDRSIKISQNVKSWVLFRGKNIHMFFGKTF